MSYFKILSAFILVGVFIVPMQADAKGTPKMDLCHWSVDEAKYVKISVSNKGFENHLANHSEDGIPGEGDLDENCEAMAEQEIRFAVAYTNLDGVDGYNPDADVLIAKVVDANGDGVLNAGDKVITDSYPTTLNPVNAATDFGSFTVNEHVIGSNFQISPFGDGYQLEISSITFEMFHFASNSTKFERYLEDNSGGAIFFIQDGISDGDSTFMNLGSPSKPESIVEFSAGVNGDSHFIDVDICPSGGC